MLIGLAILAAVSGIAVHAVLTSPYNQVSDSQTSQPSVGNCVEESRIRGSWGSGPALFKASDHARLKDIGREPKAV